MELPSDSSRTNSIVLAFISCSANSGWIPEARMIGQSGKTVKPRIFISIGTSGATHYTTGFLKAKTIVAIDRNPRAPIFGISDLGIVGDLREIIPCLIDELKNDVR